MAIYGAFNFWLYVRANKKKGDVPDGDSLKHESTMLRNQIIILYCG